MSQRPCDKCGEMVNATKAFCPACGHALVEEEAREGSSEFHNLDGTMQVGKTMYNQMLSDMGLNISAASQPSTEVVKPAAAPEPKRPPAQPPRAEVLQPIAQSDVKSAGTQPSQSGLSGLQIGLIVGGIVAVTGLFLLALFVFFAILPRLR